MGPQPDLGARGGGGLTEPTDRAGDAGPIPNSQPGAAPDPATAPDDSAPGRGEGTPAAPRPPAARPAADAGPTDDELVERVVASRVLHRGRYLEFRVDTIERADGTRSERDIAGHPGAVAILALDPDERVLLVRQWRTPAGRVLLEIPAGTLDIDPASGAVEDPDLASRRELEEETGYRAGRWERLSAFFTAPGFTSEHMTLYLATELVAAHPDERLGPDEDEHLRLERRSVDEALAAVDSGEIADAKSIVGLLWLDRRRRSAERLAERAAPSAEPDPGGGDGEEPILVRSFRLTTREAILSNAWVGRRSRFLQAMTVVLILGAVGWLANGSPLGFFASAGFAVLTATGLYFAPFTLFAVRRYGARAQPRLTVAFGRDRIEFRAPNGTSTLAWSSIVRIQDAGGFLYLRYPPSMYRVPIRIFDAADLARIRQLALDSGIGRDGRRHPAR